MSFAASPEPFPARFPDRLILACGLAWGAGLLYGVAALHHLGDRRLAAVAALTLSVALFAWTAVLYRAPSRAARIAGVVLGLAVLGVWIAADPARAAAGPLGAFSGSALLCSLLPAGLPVTAGQWSPGAIGTLVSIANVDVLALVATVAAVRAGGRVVGVLGGALVLLSCVALALAGGGAHAH